MRYSRCNPFGSDGVRAGTPCQASPQDIADQAYSQWLRQEARKPTPPVKAKADIKPGERKHHPKPPGFGINQPVIPIVPAMLPIRQQCIGMLASSGKLLASSSCHLAGCVNILASSGLILTSSGCRLAGNSVLPTDLCIGIKASSQLPASSACHIAGSNSTPIFLASSGILRVSSHLHVTG